jgi:hypothetical protein
MRKYTISTLALVLLLALQAFAQEHYTEGPVWQVTLIRVKPTQMDAYLTTLRSSTKPIYDEMKKEGTILDYKVFLKYHQTRSPGLGYFYCAAIQEFRRFGWLGGQGGDCSGQGSRVQASCPATRRETPGYARNHKRHDVAGGYVKVRGYQANGPVCVHRRADLATRTLFLGHHQLAILNFHAAHVIRELHPVALLVQLLLQSVVYQRHGNI